MSEASGYEYQQVCAWCGDELPCGVERFCSEDCEHAAYYVEPCTYCGLPADSVDHVIPLALRDTLREVGGWRNKWGRISDTVPSCRECNSVAGAKVFDTIDEKRRYIHDRMRDRYASVLRMPQWTDEDKAELGPGLRQYVDASQELASLVRARLRWRKCAQR